MMPLAPPRLSTTTCLPNAADSFCAITRAKMSYDPPAG
jgi:hypothetical protein